MMMMMLLNDMMHSGGNRILKILTFGWNDKKGQFLHAFNALKDTSGKERKKKIRRANPSSDEIHNIN